MSEPKSSINLRLDLGIRRLIPEWKRLFSIQWLREDIVAGVTVACIALPLSLAIALASGVEPATGLITAIVASLICALFGGTPLSVSGPAAAMTVLVGSVIHDFGLGGLIVVGFTCGLMQLITGILGLGQLVRFVPIPVVAGFTAGIGAIILVDQVPKMLGIPVPDGAHLIDAITNIRNFISETSFSSLAMALSTVGITLIMPHFYPRVPAPLIAVVVPSLIVAVFGISVETIGVIPNYLPTPKMPTFPRSNWGNLLGSAAVVYALASLETLLSSSAVDKLSKGERHDPDQELIGQGLGNMASAIFGGIPVTGVIARSALNIHAGAKTRRSAMVHALVLLLTVYFFSTWMGRIPVAVLAGVLLSVALRMLHPRELIQFWRSSRGEAVVYLVTFFVILFVDLLVGVQSGVIAAVVMMAIRYGRSRTNVRVFDSVGPSTISIDGPLTFLSSSKIGSIRSSLSEMDLSRGAIVDVSKVRSVDASGANQLVELLEQLHKSKVKFVVRGLSPECRQMLFSTRLQEEIASHIAANEFEVMEILGKEGAPIYSRLIYGVERFQKEMRAGYQSLFKTLAEGQSPHTLFITCSDSRIDPNLITFTQPGELFIVRNVGNIIPPFGKDALPAEGAALEFAIGVLGVREIVVCGHSGCGAMKALASPDFFSKENREKFPNMVNWLEVAKGLTQQLPPGASLDQAAELNSLLQLKNLITYPLIRDRVEKGTLRLNAWFYNIGEAELEAWDEEKKMFVRIGSQDTRSMEKRIEAGIQYQVPKW